MNLNLEELMVLANADRPMKPQELATKAVQQYQNPRFDLPVALVKVQEMVQSGLLMKGQKGSMEARAGYVEISRLGYGELLQAMRPLEQLRSQLGMVQYRVVR